MDKKLTSITIDNYFSQDLAKDIVDYIKKKRIEKVIFILLQEKEKPKKKIFYKKDFEELKDEIEDSLNSEGHNFYITLPKIKTSWEEFTYGVEANSYESDFKETFNKYESD